MTKYRIRYAKGEQVKFIAHLDMLKVFSRAAIRAEIPIVYSTGYNPHPDFVFGMPLAVGVTSDAEYVDTSLSEYMPPEEVMKRFNDTMPEGIKILECSVIGPGTPNIMKAVRASSYYIEAALSDPDDPGASQEELFSKMKAVFDKKESVKVMKWSKNGEKEIDITPLFFEFLLKEAKEKTCVMYLETSAGNEATLRPELALSGISSAAGVKCDIERIHRIALLQGR